METALEMIRVEVPDHLVQFEGTAGEVFEILDNTQNLTEEFLYAHQPLGTDTVNVYSTSSNPVGKLDHSFAKDSCNVVTGPAIVVARKGYAGRLSVVNDDYFIVHEDAYPIRPRSNYIALVDLDWFAGHYSMTFQADRTSYWGIGDFPRERFRRQNIILPEITFQKNIADLYRRRQAIVEDVKGFQAMFHSQIDRMVGLSKGSEEL